MIFVNFGTLFLDQFVNSVLLEVLVVLGLILYLETVDPNGPGCCIEGNTRAQHSGQRETGPAASAGADIYERNPGHSTNDGGGARGDAAKPARARVFRE